MFSSTVDQEIKDLVCAEMRESMLLYLKHNPQDSVHNIAIDMVLQDIKVEFVSRLTGVPIDEINKLQNIKH